MERLQGICKEKIESSNKGMRKSTNLFDPSWTHYVAGELGYQRALEELIELTEVTKDA